MKKRALVLVPGLLTVLLHLAVGCGGEHSAATAPCNETRCMNGVHTCVRAACMTTGSVKRCEYAPKLTGACRCVPGHQRTCPDSTVTTCVPKSASETAWDPPCY
jgi:hypothetical protein